LLNICSLLHAA